MIEGPTDGLAALGFVAGNGVIEREFEAALGRIGYAVDAVFKIQPAGGFALAIALETAETLGV